jgi:hypothetical protein
MLNWTERIIGMRKEVPVGKESVADFWNQRYSPA